MVNGLPLYSAFLSGHSKHCKILPNIHPFIHTFTHNNDASTMQGDSQPVGSSWDEGVLLRGHLDTLARRSQGIERATFPLPAKSLCPPPETALCRSMALFGHVGNFIFLFTLRLVAPTHDQRMCKKALPKYTHCQAEKQLFKFC